VKRYERYRIGGSFGASEIPLLLILFYLFNKVGKGLTSHFFVTIPFHALGEPSERLSSSKGRCPEDQG
jgi:hypothetical protein